MHGIKWTDYIVEMAVTTCFTFSIEAMVRGYHVYQSVWEAVNGKVLECSREIGNRSDPYAVAVTKSSGETGGTVTVGHIPPQDIIDLFHIYSTWRHYRLHGNWFKKFEQRNLHKNYNN